MSKKNEQNRPLSTSQIVAKMLDPRTRNFGNVGGALVKAAQKAK